MWGIAEMRDRCGPRRQRWRLGCAPSPGWMPWHGPCCIAASSLKEGLSDRYQSRNRPNQTEWRRVLSNQALGEDPEQYAVQWERLNRAHAGWPLPPAGRSEVPSTMAQNRAALVVQSLAVQVAIFSSWADPKRSNPHDVHVRRPYCAV
jgi:hypothetical protein